MEDTVEATSLGAQEDADVQEEIEDKPREDATVVMTHQLDVGEVSNTTILIATSHTAAVSAKFLDKTAKKPHHLEI